jgi:hypothetical protein
VVPKALVKKSVELTTGQLAAVLAESTALSCQTPQLGVDRLAIAHALSLGLHGR